MEGWFSSRKKKIPCKYVRIATSQAKSNSEDRRDFSMVYKSKENLNRINHLESTINSIKNHKYQTKNPDQFSQMNYRKVKIIEKCGVGNFSIIYSVKVTGFHSILALKKTILDEDHNNRQEFFAKRLKSPYVVKFYDTYHTEQKGKKYLNILMEKYSHNLAESIWTENIPPLTIKLYIYQMFRSLSYIHSHKILHRDIKPQNYLVQRNRIMLGDFGCSKILEEGKESVAYICSREYRAPELLFGSKHYGLKVDIWSLGCIIAEIFLKKPLFKGNSIIQQIIKILQVLGSPNWKDISFVENSQSSFPKIRGRSLRYTLQSVREKQVINLLQKILRIQPSQRITALEALTHPYFDELREQSTYWQIKRKTQIPSLFYFTKKQLEGNEHLMSKLVPFWVRQHCRCYNIPYSNFG